MQGLSIYMKSLEAVLEAQPQWAEHGNPRVDLVWSFLEKTGLDIERARRDMDDPKILARLKQDADDIKKLNIRQTPTLFINGKLLQEFSPEGLSNQVASEIRSAYKP